MPVLTEPVAPDTRRALRRATLDLVAGDPRRVFAPVLHVGTPGGLTLSLELAVPDRLGHGLRADLVAAMLARIAREDAGGDTSDPVVWVTRPGRHKVEDVDAAWLAAARAACAEAGVSLTMVVITRDGWWDPRSGVRQVWRRLRQR